MKRRVVPGSLPSPTMQELGGGQPLPPRRSPHLVRHHVLRIVLAVLVLSLTPLAHASPPDPTCIPGLYDDGDYDDAIVVVTGMMASLDREPSHHSRHDDVVIGLVVLVGESVHAMRAVSFSCTRAPPVASPLSRSV